MENSFIQMKWKNFILLTAIFLVVFLLGSFAVANVNFSFEMGEPNYSISKIYGPETEIRGWTNLSLENVPIDTKLKGIFEDEDGNEFETEGLSLEDLLSFNFGEDYKDDCIPRGCGMSYSAEGEVSSFELDKGKNKIVGLVFDGDDFRSIDSFSIEIESDAGESEKPQLLIDILNDGNIEWASMNPSEVQMEENYGVFGEGEVSGDTTMSHHERCNTISLEPTPKLKIGARVSGGNLANFTLTIENLEGDYYYYGKCEESINGESKVSCIAKDNEENFIVKESGDFRVCISADEENARIYRIDYFNIPGNGLAYETFSQPYKFDSVGDFVLNDTEIEKYSPTFYLPWEIEGYISDRYESDCSIEGCIVPIRLISGKGQEVEILSVDIEYETEIGGDLVSPGINEIHHLTSTSATYSSGFQIFHLDLAEFKTPSDLGKYNFTLMLGEESIFTEEVEVSEISRIKRIRPSSAAMGVPTTFTAEVETPENVTVEEYKWNFGDETPNKTSITNKIEHTYESLGEYEISLTIRDSDGHEASFTQTITVETPKNWIETNLKNLESNLEEIEGAMGDFSIFQRNSLEEILNLDEVREKVRSARNKYDEILRAEERGESEEIIIEGYLIVVNEMLEIEELPTNIVAVELSEGVDFFPRKEEIGVSVVEDATDSSCNEEELICKNVILDWYYENFATRYDFASFFGFYDEEISHLIDTVEMRIESNEDEYYLFYSETGRVVFDKEHRTLRGYEYIELSGRENINFYSERDLNFERLPIFLSPSFDELELFSIRVTDELYEDEINFLLIGIFIVLLIIWLVAYIFVQRWYRYKYERYLFPNKNHLYNLINYVDSAKKKDVSNRKIKKKLSKIGWNSEKIEYVLRKYDGKRTGMIEIPIDRLFEKRPEKFKKNMQNFNK